MILIPQIQEVATYASDPLRIADMTGEPSLFSCNPEAAEMLGGPHTRAFVQRCMEDPAAKSALASGLYPVLDTRTQRLMPGMFPSIPGWHCDNVPRDTYYSQPDFTRVHPDSVHFLMLLATEADGVSRTEFLTEPFEFNPNPQEVWKSLHQQITAVSPPTMKVEPGVIYRFSCQDAHKTNPCTTRGWRIFMRLSFLASPAIGNMVSEANQVYILSEENGW